MTKNKIVFFLGLGIPAIFVFRALILPGPVVWGDAPYFYPEALREFVTGPFAWMSFGNNFGGVNSFLFIYPLMFLYGSLHSLFGFSNDILIRLLFYFPAVILAFASPVFFARYLGYSRIVQFFASLVYGLNTYFLLVVDGGQVGVALSYGLFPLALLFVRNLLKEPSFLGFFLALLFLFLITIADPRLAAIGVFTVLLLAGVEWLALRKTDEIKNFKFLVTLVFANILLSLYWLIPTFYRGEGALATGVSGLGFLSLLNSLFLFQPHWPQNEFGRISSPPFYFVVLPLLVFGSLFWIKDRKSWSMALLVLIFAFLVKGETPPLGGVYSWVVNLPFGPAFRDSTKFFAPLLLFAGVLVGITGETIGKLLKNYPTLLHRGVVLLIYSYLLFLVHPAILGNLNGVLAGRTFPQDFGTVHKKLAEEDGFLRSLWFPERSPFAFHTEEKPALDAKYLVDKKPFASLNVGSFDAFNFLHNPEAIQWFDILGIKYLILSGDPRKPTLSEAEQKDWGDLLSLVGARGLEKMEWGVNIPVYRVPEIKPHVYATNKLVAVVGADDIYGKLKKENDKFSIGNQGFVFFEDGKFNPRSLQEVAPESVVLVLNGKDETDLTMSFLQEHFVGPSESEYSQWAIRPADDYLRSKYELLINGIDTKELDYAKGIAFSSVKGEKISWDLPIPTDGDYILAVRVLEERRFSWDTSDVSLKKGVYPLRLINDTGFKVVNVVALIPKTAWIEAQDVARNLISRFKVVGLNESSEAEQLVKLAEGRGWQKVFYEKISPVRYKINIPEGLGWLVFSDSYNKGWILKRGPVDLPSYPFYSMINGFHPRPEWGEAEVVFEGQEDVRWGSYLSTLSFLSLVIIFLWFYPKTKNVD